MTAKRLRGRNRARNLALPFVVTAATACAARAAAPTSSPRQGETMPNPQGEAPASTGNATTGGPEAHVISKPPTAPTATKPTGHSSNPPPPPAKPMGISSNPPPPPLVEAPTSDGRVIHQADGTCIWVEDFECPPNKYCSAPPPPDVIACPPGGTAK